MGLSGENVGGLAPGLSEGSVGPKRAILVPSGVDGVRRLTLTRLPNPRGVKEVRYADTDGQCQQEPVSGLERSPGPGRGPCQAGQSRDQNAPDTLHVGGSHGEKAYSHRIRMEDDEKMPFK